MHIYSTVNCNVRSPVFQIKEISADWLVWLWPGQKGQQPLKWRKNVGHCVKCQSLGTPSACMGLALLCGEEKGADNSSMTGVC